ncbi:prominin-like protein isoform X1 [Drosophila novamexicana]|uniref:prominin-like protein isoform X1 n=1 Tax=Drosophila novamexicana TaxID=47314 RepID=UPI0011E5F763|nr:prominin-like protein isoform X1 [Drosophila novamexicana]XP_030560864.1 prominin-like protein isoform X1 [Drosophila novamexicana]
MTPAPGEHLKSKTTHHKSGLVLAICSLSVIMSGFALATLISPTHADEGNAEVWRVATAHEKLGQLHFSTAEFTEYKSKANYTKEPKYSTKAMDPVYNFTRYFFGFILPDEAAIPPGYVVVKDGNYLALGPKVENNDWRDLLTQYWMVLIAVVILAILAVIMPIIAVCYCCFCCCRRCKEGCPPCDSQKDARRRCCCGLLLLLLIIGILFGVIIAFATNRLLDRGLEETTTTMRRGSQDTCTYLKDVSDHIHHLLVNNYGEMDKHLSDILTNAHTHIFLDLMDASEANAVYDLKRILENMEEAQKLIKEVDKLEKDLRFYGTQLRDGVRGVKRDVNYACAVLCGNRECLHFLKKTEIEFLDNSKCLQFDQLPDTTYYSKAIEYIIAKNSGKTTKEVIDRLQYVGKRIKAGIDPLIPPIIRDIHNGQEQFRTQANNIRSMIDAAISDIHLNTVRSTKTFEDVYDKYGADRSIINVIVCSVLLIILLFLIIALICGCCGRRRRGYRDDCCSKGTGASCLLLAMLLIFCVFSIVVLVGLFYFVVGLATYQGACAPLRDQESNALFRQLNSIIDLNRYLPKSELKSETPLPPLRISNAIRACQADQSIFKLLQENDLYDIDDLVRFKVISETPSVPISLANLDNFTILTEKDKRDLAELRGSNLSSYHSKVFTDVMCTQLTPVDLPTMANQLKELRASLWSQWGIYDWARTSLYNEAYNLQRYHDEFVEKIKSIISKMTEKLLKIDELILYNGNAFGESIKKLHESTERSEVFLRAHGEQYVSGLRENLTSYIKEQVVQYIEMVVDKCHGNVGKCAPLAQVYNRSVDLICHRLVDPMNGFWVGVLLCGVLFLPVLFVAHRLLCLYKKIDPYSAPPVAIVEGGSDYLYDAYSEREREHVPLANVPKKRRKAYDRRREQQEYYEDASPSVSRVARSGAGGGPGGVVDAAAGSSNMRYNDVAPTHWDHEPPRYHNPPVAPPSSEYERPPPYYYPGASDQD